MNFTRWLKSLFNHWQIVLVEILLILFAFIALMNPSLAKNTFLIAVIAPLSGTQASIGKDVLASLTLFAERINKYGGINGKRLKIQAYDHQDRVKIATEIADIIIKKDKAVAVIGSFSDPITQATETIFHRAHIPVVVPVSTIKKHTEWNFQISPTSNESGVYLAHYIKQVLNKHTVTIVHSNNKNDLALVQSFKQTFTQLGGKVQQKNLATLKITDFTAQSSSTTAFNLIEQYPLISSQRTDHTSDHLLFFATQSKSVAAFIVDLKRQQVKLPIMSMDNTLAHQLKIYPEERHYPGFFSEGIYTPSILLLDSINRPKLALVKKDYDLTHHQEISRTAMTAVLSASLITKNLASLNSKTHDINQIRHQIQSGLQKDTWFNPQQIGLATNIFVGVFQHQNMISAAINPTLISIGDLPHLKQDRQQGKLFTINQQDIYKTNFVYSGISMNKISDININDLSYYLDFFLWFRYQDNISQADDIEFLNTEKPERLYDLLETTTKNKSAQKKQITDEDMQKNEVTLISSHSSRGETYHRYWVKARFKTTSAKNYVLGQQNIYIKFRHNEKNLFKLNYVSDFVNANNGIFNQENHHGNSHLIDDPSLTLNYNVAYLGISHKNMLGSPQGFNKSTQFSEFIAEYRVKATPSSFRGIVSWVNTSLSGREDIIKIAPIVFLLTISTGVFILVIYLQRQQLFENVATLWWALQGLMIFFILLFGELVLSEFLYSLKYYPWGESQGHLINQLMLYLQDSVAILWWFIPAYYITSAFEQFLWRPIERKTGTEIPHILRLFVNVIVYLLAGLGVLSFVLNVTITGLAATSGLIAIIFALASKIDLSNLIAGLGISFAKTFYMGDWVKINNAEEGQVIEMNARSTKLLTTDSSLITMPNTTIANAVIENYNRPDSLFRLVIPLKIVPIYPFERVEKVLLDAITTTQGVLEEPAPYVLFKGQGIACQMYEIAFFINDYAKRGLLQMAWRRIWRHLAQANITLMALPRKIYTPPEIEIPDFLQPATVLINCDAFSFLPIEKIKQLAQHLDYQSYQAGEIILTDPLAEQQSLFIITEGVVCFNQRSRNTQIETRRLGVADVFGELSLLDCQPIKGTAVAKTATKLLMITHQNFIKVINTEIAQHKISLTKQ
jgi:branched-chain amino acid transport system substrate-binding protein